jgi:hypothetical protein
MDYAMPRADDVPSFKVGTKVTPCTHNPLGAKGCGEAGAIGAPAAHDERGPRRAAERGRQVSRHAGVAASRVERDPVGEARVTQEEAMYAFELTRAKTVADAAAALAKSGGKALAGGQSLVGAMKLRLRNRARSSISRASPS